MSTIVKRSSPVSAPEAEPQLVSSVGCLVHIFWMVFGNAALFMLAVVIYQQPRWPLSWRDGAFLLTVVAMVIVRWIDIQRYHGATASGELATPAHWRRYTWFLLVLALLTWGAAHFLPKLAS